jgi:hypothetical protein
MVGCVPEEESARRRGYCRTEIAKISEEPPVSCDHDTLLDL